MEQHDAGFVAFATARARPLLRSAWLLTGDWHVAQDLVQDTLARMFQTWDKIDLIDTPDAYAQVVLVRTFLSMRRRRRFFERPTDQVLDVPAKTDDSALRLTLNAALGRLSRGDRAVLVLRYLCDRSIEQVAVDLDRSPSAIRSMSSRALRRLRAELGDDALPNLAVTDQPPPGRLGPNGLVTT